MDKEYPQIVKDKDHGIYIQITAKSRMPGRFTSEHFAQVALKIYKAEVAENQRRIAAKRNKE